MVSKQSHRSRENWKQKAGFKKTPTRQLDFTVRTPGNWGDRDQNRVEIAKRAHKNKDAL
jgi:hypothetical protein